MSEHDQAYYEDRAVKARELAAEANDPKIAAIHLEMATSYDRLAVLMANPPGPRTMLRVVGS